MTIQKDAFYHYLAPISNHPELKQMRSVLMSRCTEVMQKAEKLKNHNMDYAYIWTDSRAEYMHYFLTYSRQLTQEVRTNLCLVFIKSSFECVIVKNFFTS